jgi:hypothetical protein
MSTNLRTSMLSENFNLNPDQMSASLFLFCFVIPAGGIVPYSCCRIDERTKKYVNLFDCVNNAMPNPAYVNMQVD